MSRIDTFTWLRTDEALARACHQWQAAEALAIDTEFVRTRTYYAQLGLIQIAVNDAVWLIDPLGIADWTPLANLLQDEAVIKVLHSLSEDCEVFQHHLGVLPRNLFDTQIAASFLGYPVQTSYAKLVAAEFDQPLAKEATRSDWLQRPLSDDQCCYAAADVYWLSKLYRTFTERLQRTQRRHWVSEDSAAAAQRSQLVAPDAYYRRLRSAWKLSDHRLAALQRLCSWREVEARRANLNRRRVMADEDLLTLAEKMPADKAALLQLGLSAKTLRLFGPTLLNIIQQAQQLAPADWPQPLATPLPASQRELLRALRDTVGQLANELELPAEILANRKSLEGWLRAGLAETGSNPDAVIQGWRAEVLATPLGQCIQAQLLGLAGAQ